MYTCFREGKFRLNILYRNEKLGALFYFYLFIYLFFTRSPSRFIWHVGVEWENTVALYRYALLNDGDAF